MYGLSWNLQFQMLQIKTRSAHALKSGHGEGQPQSPCVLQPSKSQKCHCTTTSSHYHHFVTKCVSLCPQLEQSQKEASDLLEQNRLLQDQLRVALGREQSAREGYVLQVGLQGCCGPCSFGHQCEGPGRLGMCKTWLSRSSLSQVLQHQGSQAPGSFVASPLVRCFRQSA